MCQSRSWQKANGSLKMGNVKTVGERLFVEVCVGSLGILTRGVHLRAGSSGSHCYSQLKGQGKGAGTRPEEESYVEGAISQGQRPSGEGSSQPMVSLQGESQGVGTQPHSPPALYPPVSYWCFSLAKPIPSWKAREPRNAVHTSQLPGLMSVMKGAEWSWGGGANRRPSTGNFLERTLELIEVYQKITYAIYQKW